MWIGSEAVVRNAVVVSLPDQMTRLNDVFNLLVEFDQMADRIARIDDRVFEHSHQKPGEGCFDDVRFGHEGVSDRTDVLTLANERTSPVVHIDNST